MDNHDKTHEYNEISSIKNDKIISSKVKVEKSSLTKKILSALISDDIPDIKAYILSQVIEHGKSTLLDIICGLINGKNSVSRNPGSNLRINHVSYDRQYNNRTNNNRRNEEIVNTERGSFRYQNLWFDDAGDANVVLHFIEDTLREYKVISVLNLYDSVDLPTDNTMAKFGWTNISGAKIVPNNGGYLLKLPKAVPIDI